MMPMNLTILINQIADDGHDTESNEKFQFVCAVKNLTEKTMHGYSQRILYLHRYAVSIEKSLIELSTREIQQYILSIIPKVCGETVNGRIRVYKVFYKALKHNNLIQTKHRVKPLKLCYIASKEKVEFYLST